MQTLPSAYGVTVLDPPPVRAWEPWSPVEVARRLADVTVPWCVVGGWALDLAAGQQHRQHEDLDDFDP